jgi:hypothetical protein
MRRIVRSSSAAFSVAAALGASLVCVNIFSPASARADEAVVVVGTPPPPDPPPDRFASPPVATSPPVAAPYDDDDHRYELYRSPMRLHVGPAGVTTGQSLGLGLGLAADFGRGSVGFRLAAAWLRGEQGDPTKTPIADGLAQYTGEVTLDFNKHGPWHPVLGVGAGIARVGRGDSGGTIGIGTAGLRIEYALAFDDADVRIGAGAWGVMAGPSDREVRDVKSYALFGASIGVGF